MFRTGLFLTLLLIFSFTVNGFGASVILNEYNSVDVDKFLNGGTAAADEDGGRASDVYFGRIIGNGGDWFELVVITDHLDMRNWNLDVYDNGVLDETLSLTDDSIWSDLRSGTIITVSEDLPSDISYNPAMGDWWINVQANNDADGLYIEASNFPVGNKNFQLRIRNSAGAVVFGPAGEGISPVSGIGGTEIFRLEAAPSTTITPSSTDYDGGDNFSTFGMPNKWGAQNFNQLRTVIAQPSTLSLLLPQGPETIMAGTTYDITWSNTGVVDNILIEFSIDNGISWSEVYPPNIGNTGIYKWLVPMIDSYTCLVRITNAANTAVYDTSNTFFSIYQCNINGDLTGDCTIDFSDLAILAESWLSSGNPQTVE